ncbi:MAG TPA: hypothetical protein VGK32_12495 [Vicinamibacterales bacterium]|jgi:hypothetical protein
MIADVPLATPLLDTIAEYLDIPRSYYEKAAARHRSLGDWLSRAESRVAAFEPQVRPQGSFRYGTVVRPINPHDDYDLDHVTILAASKTAMTQRQLKELYGAEIRDYAEAHGILQPVEEKHRCWRLPYADEVRFHLDSLPCLPEEPGVIRMIALRGVPYDLAAQAVAITDRRHPLYDQITTALLSSNPDGFAAWFEGRTRPVATDRIKRLLEASVYASVEDVPPYEWKTPLQRSIQLLKRHRDVMFEKARDKAPISMVITNLATHAYGGEADLFLALEQILTGMPRFVRDLRPRVPNPADPAEDYADKWARDPSLEDNFWAWHTQAKVDVARLARSIGGKGVATDVRRTFHVDLTEDERKRFERVETAHPQTPASTPVVYVTSPPRPWGQRD